MTKKQKTLDALTSVYPETLAIGELATQLEMSLEGAEQLLTELQNQKFPIRIQGHRASLSYPLLSRPIISRQLETDLLGASLQLHAALESTNTYAKENLDKLKNGEVILAHEQTAGKGRMGRNWSSPAGASISMSLVLKPDIPLEAIPLLTQLTAAALVNALGSWTDAKIKWPNDIIINKKKIAGILVETEFSGNSLQGIVIGIGINTNVNQTDIADDLQLKATSIKEALNRDIDPNKLVADFLNHFEAFYHDFLSSQRTEPFLSVCRNQSVLIGKNYWIIDADQRRKAHIETIDPSGGLVVRFLDTNETEILTSTAVSIRGDDTYV